MSESLDQEIRTLQSIYWSERDPDGLAFAPLADAFLRKGEIREALDLLADGTSRHPDFTTGHIVATRLYVEQGMHGEAEFATRRVLDLDPGNIVALSTLATILDDRGEWDETATLRGTLLGLDPEWEEAGSAPQIHASVADDTTDLSDAATGQLIELGSVEEVGPGFLPDEMDLGGGEAADEDPGLRDALFALGLSDESVGDAGPVDMSEALSDSDAVEAEGVSVADVNADSTAEPIGGETALAGAETEFEDLDSIPVVLAGIDDEDSGAAGNADTDAMDLEALLPELEVELDALDLGEPDAEPVMDLAGLAPDAMPEAEPELEVMDLGSLAPDAEPEAEPELEVMDLGSLAPDAEPEAEPELEVMDLGSLAPDAEPEAEPELEVMELGSLAPDAEPEAEPELEVMDLGSLAPDAEPEAEPELEVMELGSLAPDAEPEAELELEVMDLGSLAPDPEAEAEPELEVMDLGSLAPDAEPEAEPELEVVDIGSLAPDAEAEAEPELEVVDIGSLAPDPEAEAEPELEVMDLGSLAPDAEAEAEPELEVMDLGSLAPDPEAEAEPELEVMDLGSLAPDAEAEAEPELEVMDLGSLAPDAEAEAEPELEVMDVAALAPEPAAAVMDLSSLVPDVDPEPEEHPDALELGATAYVMEESPDVDNEEPIYTRTLAELYVTQGFVDQALGVLRSLLEADPNAEDLRVRIAELEGAPAWMDSLAPGGGPEADTPADSTDEESPAEEEPDTAATTEEDVETLARDLAEIGNGGDDVDTPFAWPGEEAEASESDTDRGDIGGYFDAILNWTSGD